MKRYPVRSGYQARRRERRAQIKAELCVILQEIERAGERPDMPALALRFQCGPSTARKMRQELGEEGLIEPPEVKRLERQNGEYRFVDTPDDLAARIAAVREAKEKARRNWLTPAELDRVLPCPEPAPAEPAKEN